MFYAHVFPSWIPNTTLHLELRIEELRRNNLDHMKELKSLSLTSLDIIEENAFSSQGNLKMGKFILLT